jgi:hypothetical protein
MIFMPVLVRKPSISVKITTKLMKFTLITILLFITVSVFGQQTHTLESKGTFKEIDLTTETRILGLLLDSNYQGKSALIDSVKKVVNKCCPPVVYGLAYALFTEGKKSEGAYWFYVAQLRARYDKNRCNDATASAVNYNQAFGPLINEYAFQNVDTLEKVASRAIEFVKNNNEEYDQRWINLSGMDAISTSLKNDSDTKPLSLPESEWPAIKAKTIEEYLSGFQQALAELRKKH